MKSAYPYWLSNFYTDINLVTVSSHLGDKCVLHSCLKYFNESSCRIFTLSNKWPLAKQLLSKRTEI